MAGFEPRSDPTSTSARWTRWLEKFNTYLLAADINLKKMRESELYYCIRRGSKYTKFSRP
jgi:hypothetical protein